MRYYIELQLEELTHEERKPLKTVKSSLKGSSSQLSLEKVAIEARKNAARRQTRNRADAILQSLLHSAEKARKVRTAAWLRIMSWAAQPHAVYLSNLRPAAGTRAKEKPQSPFQLVQIGPYLLPSCQAARGNRDSLH